jgi:Uncharacterized low-complexity proteins
LFVEAVNEASAVEDERVARRKKEFVGATFGAFDIAGATLDAGDEHPIRLDHARFTAGVRAFDAVFEHEFLTNRARFETGDGNGSGEIGEVSFQSAKFSGDGEVSFEFAKFRGEEEVSFRNAEFSGDGEVSFRLAKFSGDGEVSFRLAKFSGDGEVLFYDAKFSGDEEVSFEECTFEMECSYIDVRFTSETDVLFTNAEFEETVTFETSAHKTVRDGNFYFPGAVFRDEVRFRSRETQSGEQDTDEEQPCFDLVFADSVDFSDATFQQGVDFSRTRFPEDTDSSEDTDLSGADLTGVNFTEADLTGASFERALLTRTELLGANLARTKLYGALLGNARINRETTFWLDGNEDDAHREPDGSPFPVRALRRVKMVFREREPYCRYDPRYRGSNGEPDLEKAGEVYATLERLANENSLPGLASECFLGRKDVQLREYWHDCNTTMIVRSFVPNLVARYGESPSRVLETGVVTVLVCGLAYDAFDLLEHADSEGTVTLFESLYFSGLTFTTLGYGDFTPANSTGQVLAVAEALTGVILLAILVFVFGRRATR